MNKSSLHTTVAELAVSLRFWAALALVVCVPSSALAQSEAEETPEEQAAAELTPPKLSSFVEAPYPAEALAEGVDGVVVLLLTIDAQGRVTQAVVEEGPGYGLDAAAREAAEQFRFEPARRNGTPVASRIRYTYRFSRDAEESSDVDDDTRDSTAPDTPQKQQSGAIAGRVLLDDGQTPAAGAPVRIIDSDSGEAIAELRADETGRFETELLPVGAYEIEVDAPGLGSGTLSTEVVSGQPTRVSMVLQQAGDDETIEVTVRGESEAERLRQSAQAVNVIETEEAQRQTADLGEVLARTEGVGVRRSGGLGSDTRLSLNGLTDDKVRVFMNGVPLEFVGYPFGIGNVPVNAVERVEIYRGVVPIRFGADALGGAINLVTDDDVVGTHGSASYQAGSFGTQRATLSARHLHEPSGFLVRAGGFFDYADNDYPVDVEVVDNRGRLAPARAHRFHDAYQAASGNLELGFVDRPWADRLIVRAFATDFTDELQHNLAMNEPYGDIEYGEFNSGGTLRYEDELGEQWSVQGVGGYAYTSTWYRDVGECIYDWFGQCVRERARPGEAEGRARDVATWEHTGFARLNLGWQLHPQHQLRMSLAPTYATRSGEDLLLDDPDARDPLGAQRDLFTVVTGLEYEADLFDERLENVVFVKDYLQLVRSEELMRSGVFSERDRDTHRLGVGNALRYRLTDAVYAKASYEWATRLPRTDEVFGNGVRVVENLEIEPETSHNLNLGAAFEARETASGAWRAEVNGFLREASNLITLLPSGEALKYDNVFGARSLGVEASAGWVSPGKYGELSANLTWVELRNTSSEGTFGDFEGDRLPNRPWLFANGSARLNLPDVADEGDELSLAWTTRYVHEFFRNWPSLGARQHKLTVDEQLLHSLALTYLIPGDPAALSFTAEVQNLTDEPAYDHYGVQRPGRGFYFKLTAAF